VAILAKQIVIKTNFFSYSHSFNTTILMRVNVLLNKKVIMPGENSHNKGGCCTNEKIAENKDQFYQ